MSEILTQSLKITPDGIYWHTGRAWGSADDLMAAENLLTAAREQFPWRVCVVRETELIQHPSNPSPLFRWEVLVLEPKTHLLHARGFANTEAQADAYIDRASAFVRRAKPAADERPATPTHSIAELGLVLLGFAVLALAVWLAPLLQSLFVSR